MTDKNPADFAERTVGFDDIGLIADLIMEQSEKEMKEGNDNR